MSLGKGRVYTTLLAMIQKKPMCFISHATPDLATWNQRLDTSTMLLHLNGKKIPCIVMPVIYPPSPPSVNTALPQNRQKNPILRTRGKMEKEVTQEGFTQILIVLRMLYTTQGEIQA